MGRLNRALLVVLLLGMAAPGPTISAETVVRAGFASISTDEERGTWTIRSAGVSLTLALGPGQDFRVVQLASVTGEPRTIGTLPATDLAVGGRTHAFGSRAAGFVFQNVATAADRFTVRLDVTYDLPSSRLRAIRHYAATSGSPTFETWTTYAALGSSVSVSDLNAFVFTIPTGTLHWLNGLQGDGTETARDSAFTLQQRNLEPGERLSLGSSRRASEQTVPWFAVDSGPDVFYGGLLWSGAWLFTAVRTGSALGVRLGLPLMSTTVSSPVDGPHAFFGLARGDIGDASDALRTYVLRSLRGGKPFDPSVTYNTWFAYGVGIDEASMRREIDGAADLGAERFVVDAGWYTGAGRAGIGDFSSGLGSWRVDPARFPSGLGALSDYAHEKGLSFGIWVEPERVALAALGRGGSAHEGWLAKSGGKYGSSEAAQLCFGSPGARQWVYDRLTAFIDAAHPDYLKWDNNFWINCDRSGHVHGPTDGNFAHVTGLYEVLARLRERYPDLAIENVSGGGNRMDFGMLRYTDAGWMDDRTTPSVKVRHNIQGLSAVFPPAYLMSFVIHDNDEPLTDAADLPLLFRSRMPGILGLSFRTGDLGEDDAAGMRHYIARYKTLRETLSTASGTLLTAQAGPSNSPSWDAYQTTPEGSRPIALWAYQSDRAVGSLLIKPVGLREQWMYEVDSAEAGPLGVLSGAALMEDGVEIVASPFSAAHMILLNPVRPR